MLRRKALTTSICILACYAILAGLADPARAAAWRVDGPEGGSVTSLSYAPSNPLRVYTSNFDGVFRSDDGGASFEQVSTVPHTTVGIVGLVVDPADQDRLLATGCPYYCNQVVRSLDGGLTWNVVLDDPSIGFGVRFGAGAAFVPAFNGLLRSDDGGATWSPSGFEGQSVDLVAFDPSRPRLVIAVPFGSQLWRSEDSGRSWQRMRTPRDWFEVYDIRFDPVRPGFMYAIANRRAVRSTDGGATWRVMLFSAREAGRVQVLGDGTVLVTPGDPTYVKIFGILRSADGGQTFSPDREPGTPLTARPDDEIGGIIASPSPHRALAAGSLGLWSTDDSGRSWRPASHGIAFHYIPALRASAGGEPRVYAGADFGIFAREGAPGRWRKTNRGPRLAGAQLGPGALLGFEVDPADSLHLIGFNTRELLDSRDGGRTWRSFSPVGLDPPCVGFVTGLTVDWSSGTVYAGALECSRGPGEPSPPRLGMTRDGGATWERLSSFVRTWQVANFLALAVDSRDPSVLWGKTQEAGLFRSGDRGHTWQPLGHGLPAIPARLQYWDLRAAFAFDPSNPQRMIAAVPGRGVWHSVNGGRSFRRLGQGLETSVVTTILSAVDPESGARRWFAGVQAEGVFRLDGDRWNAVGTFADPSQFTGTFVFDPVDPAVLYAGTYGRSALRLDLGER